MFQLYVKNVLRINEKGVEQFGYIVIKMVYLKIRMELFVLQSALMKKIVN